MTPLAPATNKDIVRNTGWEPCHVILVDDDDDDRRFAMRELQASPYVKDVTCLASSEDLMGYMRRTGFMDRSVIALTPLLILVDLEMPERDGLSVIRDLKGDQFLRDIPLIVVSGTMDGAKLGQARTLGANGVFRKPLRREIIADYLSRAWKWPPDDLWAS